MCYNFVLEDVKPYCALQAAGCCPNGSFWPKDLHLQCVLGNPRTGGVRSCSWYCRKELVLGVGRVNVPGNLVCLKMAESRQLLLKKYVRLGLGLTGWRSPVPSPLSCPLRVGCSCFWFDLGNLYRRLLRVGFFPCSLSVAPVP